MKPTKICYKPYIEGVAISEDQDVLYVDMEHFNEWTQAQDKEALLRKWFAPVVQSC